MATKVFDIRGMQGDKLPRDVLGDDWTSRLPRDRMMGVRSFLNYEFLNLASTPVVFGANDLGVMLMQVPRSELWKILSITLTSQSGTAIDWTEIGAYLSLHYARWDITTKAWFKETFGIGTRMRLISSRREWANDSELYAQWNRHSRDNPLFESAILSGETLGFQFRVSAGTTVTTLNAFIVAKRYPSPAELRRMLEAKEIDRCDLMFSRPPFAPEAPTAWEE